ncbi:unnamed protein product [Linum tenue]|uniref:F-box domain-containing protein n=1 Tax=Linum tenue TaxID=586396 RepID=A0AAV0PBQ2_9ROSI|nr:unnamed protein product [Linum tenue]
MEEVVVVEDLFDRLPDSLIFIIFNSVSDVKTLIRCRSVSKRFNSLVPETESLSLRVDRVISSSAFFDDDDSSPFLDFFKSIVQSIQGLLNFDLGGDDEEADVQNCYSPGQILSGFERIRRLEIELPSGDLQMEKGVLVKWRAEFGTTLRNCVILGFRIGNSDEDSDSDLDLEQGMKTVVVWTISALIAASARHYLLRDVVAEGMERLVLKDAEGEGTLVMEEDGLREWRRSAEVEVGGGGDGGWEGRRTVLPSVRMRMRHQRKLRLESGAWIQSATLVVVRPSSGGGGGDVAVEEEKGDGEMAMAAYGGGAYEDVVGALLKTRSYSLEMNSF